ncbi:unnamed protein product [Symbiodinium necroappetens]|uniref:Uncharacterized protein n=1 Tax=Symbiodinium necroappetens TaxID=1628268 RepID=A0A812YVT5_9DINO|nr:unnamed protein product [Symbiodinium necroappetens]
MPAGTELEGGLLNHEAPLWTSDELHNSGLRARLDIDGGKGWVPDTTAFSVEGAQPGIDIESVCKTDCRFFTADDSLVGLASVWSIQARAAAGVVNTKAVYHTGMEVHVESANPDMLPKSCYVSVRVGEVLKQGRYEPQRAYTFPAIDRRRDVRVDVYQHVGSCILSAEPDSASIHDVFATSTHPDFPAMKFKEVQKSKTDRAAKMKGRAKARQRNHPTNITASETVQSIWESIESKLLGDAQTSCSPAMMHADPVASLALLKDPDSEQGLSNVDPVGEQPADAVDFVCKYLAGTKKDSEKEKQLPPLASGSTKAAGTRPLQKEKEPEKVGEESFVTIDGTPGPPAPSEAEDPRNSDLPAVRSQVCQLLVEAAENGQLESALRDAKTDPQEGAAMNGVRMKTANLLMQAADNGDLEEAIRQIQEGPQNDQVRLKVANLLMTASENGDLHKALTEIKENKAGDKNMSKDEARERAAGLLIEAAENGTLEQALAELKTPTADELTTRVAKALFDAMQNGELEKAMAGMPTGTAPTEPAPENSFQPAAEAETPATSDPTPADPAPADPAPAEPEKPSQPTKELEGKAEVVEETNASGNAA